VDAGVVVPHSEEKIVKERMKGEHIAKYAKGLGAGSEEYTAKFSKYIAQGVAPEKIPEHFNKVKAEIINVSKGGKPTAEAEAKAPKETKEAAPATKKAPQVKRAAAKKPAAKKEVAPEKKKAVKEKTLAKEEKAPKSTKDKASIEAPKKEKASKKGGKKA
jgi:hypothetical protein